jgi:hypothetical protein
MEIYMNIHLPLFLMEMPVYMRYPLKETESNNIRKGLKFLRLLAMHQDTYGTCWSTFQDFPQTWLIDFSPRFTCSDKILSPIKSYLFSLYRLSQST